MAPKDVVETFDTGIHIGDGRFGLVQLASERGQLLGRRDMRKRTLKTADPLDQLVFVLDARILDLVDRFPEFLEFAGPVEFEKAQEGKEAHHQGRPGNNYADDAEGRAAIHYRVFSFSD